MILDCSVFQLFSFSNHCDDMFYVYASNFLIILYKYHYNFFEPKQRKKISSVCCEVSSRVEAVSSYALKLLKIYSNPWFRKTCKTLKVICCREVCSSGRVRTNVSIYFKSHFFANIKML